MYILGVILARGGSKRLKNKNILELNGKPLIGYTIEAALASTLLNKVIVSTESSKITDVVRDKYKKVEIIRRPTEFAKDDSPIEEALLHAVEYLKGKEGYKTDIVVWMQANVPIRKKGVINEVVNKLLNSDADSCVTCYEADQIPELMKVINSEGRLIPIQGDVDKIRYQEFPKRYLLDGSVVALRARNLIENRGVRKAHVYLGKKTLPVIQQSKMYSVEIDNPQDIILAEYYIKQLDV